ncbi:hypothetical protein BKA62DRAFT_623535 [Auriculariales sp. MPI-PUGE-AT-0066]|nr:hypothetical protein BKA62DRAFT_623535 [Auriculariales sp. MPI-PUGE-AT-0066]
MLWTLAQDAATGEIVCVMRTEEVENALETPYEPVNSVAYGGSDQVTFFDNITRIHRDFMKSRPHRCLHIMATHPAHQGRGAARALLSHLTQIADAEGRPLYLEATQEAVPVYAKFGWVPTGAMEVLPTGALEVAPKEVVTMMIREPQRSP